TVTGRSPAAKGLAPSLSKTWNVAKLTSQTSSSQRVISWLTAALRIIVSSGGEVLARDASLASANDNPAAPRTGTALLRRFRLEFCFVRDMGSSPRLAAFCCFSRCTIGLTCFRCHDPESRVSALDRLLME